MKSGPTNKPGNISRWALLIAVFLLFSACSNLKPKKVSPWDRDILAKPEMQLDAEFLETVMDEKIYFSKEASRGGAGIGGGGCGCN